MKIRNNLMEDFCIHAKKFKSYFLSSTKKKNYCLKTHFIKISQNVL